MAATYEPIATTTASGSTASITFSSISSSFTDLILVGNFTLATNAGLFLRFNGDTGSNYSYTRLIGTGSAASSARDSNQTQTQISAGDLSQASNFVSHIQNYSNATTNKTLLTRFDNPAGATCAFVGLWRDTSAINSVEIRTGGANFNSGGTFTLYGLLSA